MQKSKTYENVFFLPEHIVEIAGVFRDKLGIIQRGSLTRIMRVQLPSEEWEHDQEDEFFSDIRRDKAEYSYRLMNSPCDLIIQYNRYRTRVQVAGLSRASIEAVYYAVEKLLPSAARSPSKEEQSEFKVFIGHGRDSQWRDLKDHLHEKHGHSVEAYEIGSRAGHAIRDVLEDMLESSTMALLVMTGEDETVDGQMHARQNVVHELGLFQGKLGYSRAIVLLEDGVEEFSNIHGVEQIRFARSNIKSTFGDVLAALQRERNRDVQ